jgi:hypothetical protein
VTDSTILTRKYEGDDVEFVGADGDDGVDSELPTEMDHRKISGLNRLIADIDDALTSPLALVLTTPGSRAFDADVDGDEAGGDGTRMGGNVQCKGKDVFVAVLNTSDSICKICSFVKIGFPKANWFLFDVIDGRWISTSFLLEERCWCTDKE